MKFHRAIVFVSLYFFVPPTSTHSPLPQGVPERWDGDKFRHAPCETIQAPPKWVDGYFFCQTSASYGKQSNPLGQKVTHMFDAISALAMFDISKDRSTFTGAYYPTKSYKIWNFYDRDFAKSSVAWWPSFSTFNITRSKMWDKIETDIDTSQPNIDFWKINNSIVAGTESYNSALTFDIPTADNFRQFPFKDADGDLMASKPFMTLQKPIHERIDPDTNMIWASVVAMNTSAGSWHQMVYTVDPQGVRKVEGTYNFAPIDPNKCVDGKYTGDVNAFIPRYMHSISSTENYIILPLSSVVVQVCNIYGLGKPTDPNATLMDASENFPFKWNPSAQVQYLIFDKRTKKFLPPIATPWVQFISHQFNAYELDKNRIVADMVVSDEDIYENIYVDKLVSPKAEEALKGYPIRVTIDLDAKSITNQSLVPEKEKVSLEFPQFNHRYEGKKYKYGYAVTYALVSGSTIVKIDVDSPDGKNNIVFKPKDDVSMAEPFFAERPGATEEDDGVVVVRGLDPSINKTRVYVLDAKTMEKVGEIVGPTLVPFGFHNRFYTKAALGMKPTEEKSFFSIFGRN